MTDAHRGPDVPHRTSRKIALEKGAHPEGFEGALEYSPMGGHPLTVGSPEQTEIVQPPAIISTPAQAQPKPFDVKE